MESQNFGDELRIMPLGNSLFSWIINLLSGGGREVGRSCVILQYKGKTVMVKINNNNNNDLLYKCKFDCGLHPAHIGRGSLPYFDQLKCDNIDLLLVTQ